MHQALLEGTHSEIAGRLRPQAVWIGGNSPPAASFVPPRHDGRVLASSIRQAQASIYAALAPKPSESMRSTVDLLTREPALTAEMLMELTKESSSSAYRNISTLESLGALKASSHIKGRKVWFAPAIIEALDEFALRAGKRIRE